LKKEASIVLQGKNPEAFIKGSTHCSPRKNPEAFLNCTSGPPGEEDVTACPVSPRYIVLTDEDPQKLAEEINMVVAAVTAAMVTVTAVAAKTATMETTVTAITAAVTTAASNNNANPQLNVQAHPRKTNP